MSQANDAGIAFLPRIGDELSRNIILAINTAEENSDIPLWDFSSMATTGRFIETIYSNDEDLEIARRNAEIINGQSGRFMYTIGEKDNTTDFLVNFNIEVRIGTKLEHYGHSLNHNENSFESKDFNL